MKGEVFLRCFLRLRNRRWGVTVNSTLARKVDPKLQSQPEALKL